MFLSQRKFSHRESDSQQELVAEHKLVLHGLQMGRRQGALLCSQLWVLYHTHLSQVLARRKEVGVLCTCWLLNLCLCLARGTEGTTTALSQLLPAQDYSSLIFQLHCLKNNNL